MQRAGEGVSKECGGMERVCEPVRGREMDKRQERLARLDHCGKLQ